jgi:hypothetical protein
MATYQSIAQVSAANTNRDGTGTLVDVVTPVSTYGAYMTDVLIVATGTTTAGVVRLFLFDGTNNRLHTEQLVTAITPSASVAVFSATVTLNFRIPNTWKLKASTHNAETFNVIATVVDQ